MAEFRTAKKGTPEFEQLIRGTFSGTQRALPVQNLRVGSRDEEVTFEIVERAQIKSKFAYFGFLGPKKLLLILFPVFYFAMESWNKPLILSSEMICIVLGLLFSILAVQIKVDIQDFISGYDRIRSDKNRLVLVNGVKTVAELDRDFKIFSGLAIILAIIPIIYQPHRILSALVTLLLFYIGYELGTRQKDRLLRDVALAVIAGPCLAYWILPLASSLVFGFVWAFFVFFALQIEHFQHYFAQTQAGEKNLITLRSIDQAPKVLWYVWGVALLVYVIVRALTSHIAWWGGSIAILLVMSFIWRKPLFALKSPAGSEIDKTVLTGTQLYYTFITLWVAELMFQAMIAPLVLAWFK
jgi:hypothetical protein